VLIVVGACALVSVLFILFGTGGDTLTRVIVTDVALIVFALLVWLDTVIGARRPEWFEFASLATNAYLLLLWIVTVWTAGSVGDDRFGDGRFGDGTAWALAMAMWVSFLSLIFVRAMLALIDLTRFLVGVWATPVARALGYVAGVSFAVIGVMVTIPSPNPLNDLWDWDYYGRIVAAVAVIGGVALVLIPLWGLLINRGRRTQDAPASFGYVASGYSASGHPASGYPRTGQPTSSGAGQGYQGHPAGYAAASVPPVPNPAAPAPYPPAAQQSPAAAAQQPPAAAAQQQAATLPTPATPFPAAAPAPAAAYGPAPGASAPHPPLAWPRLADGRPVPVGPDGAPAFAAVHGAPLAWPTFVDGTPVPAGADGSPLYR
jgi:hypothetical protein